MIPACGTTTEPWQRAPSSAWTMSFQSRSSLGFTMGPRFLTDIISFWNNTTPDLFVSGPNEGNNLGPFIYTLSGTVGSTYSAVERGIPGIAFSAGNATHRSYTTVSSNGTNDVAILNAAAAVKV